MESEKSSSDQEIVNYQQEEVVWAKIKGYPWWPAFVDKIHRNQDPQQTAYTVFFFGDNTHSRLGHLKIRRFLDRYTEFFSKAKNNRKLYLSIIKAEEKLKQNAGNTDVFQTLRTEILKGKKLKFQNLQKSKQLQNIQLPQNSAKKSQTLPKKQSHQQRQQSSPQFLRSNSKRRVASKLIFEYGQQNEILSPESSVHMQQRKQQIEEIYSQQGKEQGKGKDIENLRLSKLGHYIMKPQGQNKGCLPYSKHQVRGRRGRPRKIDYEASPLRKDSNHSMEVEEPLEGLIGGPDEIQARNGQIKAVIAQKENQLKILVLERVRFCLDKRQQLIEYLDELTISNNIVKDILDLNVVNSIIDGEPSAVSIRVLQKLKMLLVSKYFPDDSKHKKRFQKLSKKPQSPETSLDQAIGQQQTLENIQLRRKTIQKISKILQNLSIHADYGVIAIQIENYFCRQDETIGNGYKAIAYKVLRSLKDKTDTVQGILNKLKNNQLDINFN